jgi:hypothetical protein
VRTSIRGWNIISQIRFNNTSLVRTSIRGWNIISQIRFNDTSLQLRAHPMAESPKPNGQFTAMQGSSPVPSSLLLRAHLYRRNLYLTLGSVNATPNCASRRFISRCWDPRGARDDPKELIPWPPPITQHFEM